MTFGFLLKKFFNNAYSTIKGAVSTVYKNVKEIFGYAGKQVNKLIDGASAVVKSLFSVATKIIDTVGLSISLILNALFYVVGTAAIKLIKYTWKVFYKIKLAKNQMTQCRIVIVLLKIVI